MDNEILQVNNNPFSCYGRISRLTYFITFICTQTFVLGLDFLKYLFERTNGSIFIYIYILGMLIVGLIEIIAIIKRLRDIKWNPWTCILMLIPYVVIVLRFVLIFMKGKYETIQCKE